MDVFKKLRVYNLIMGGFHLLQAGLILWLSRDFKLPLTTDYLQLDAVTGRLKPVFETVAEVGIGQLVALFLLLSALAHFIISLPRVYEWYVANLKKGINYARWYEYALSSSLMIVLIALLAGMYSLPGLILVFFLNMMMILFGLVMELHNQTTTRTDWTSFNFGSLAGLIPWVVIAMYLFGAGEGENRPPDFVYGIFFSIFLFFNTFAINMWLQYRKIGKWKNYLFGEAMYILLSLVAKSLLAWQIFGGTLRPN